MGQKQSNTVIGADEVDRLVETTNFDRREIKLWRAGFLKDNPSGHLTLEDFTHTFSMFFPTGTPNEFAHKIFNAFDIDKDGMVSFAEYMQTLSITSKGSFIEKLEWAFGVLDEDSDGVIDKEELVSFVKGIYHMVGDVVVFAQSEDTPLKRVHEIFASLEKDEDDTKITLHEFVTGCSNHEDIRYSCEVFNGLH